MKLISDILKSAADALSRDNKEDAIELINKNYPFIKSSKNNRNYTQIQSLEVFVKDGFIDRYTGIKLIYPSALYALAHELPQTIPLGGGRSHSHKAHWDLFPTVDHLFPVSRGGVDEMSNWMTTSMTTNMAKSSSTLDELGWKLYETGDLKEWDGLCSWYISYLEKKPYLKDIKNNKGWHNAIINHNKINNLFY